MPPHSYVIPGTRPSSAWRSNGRYGALVVVLAMASGVVGVGVGVVVVVSVCNRSQMRIGKCNFWCEYRT